MNTRHLLSVAAIGLLSAAVAGQGLSPAQILRPLPDSWPTYHGDYTGRHFSPLTQITPANVKGLSLAWVSRFSAATQGAIIGGEGPEPTAAAPGGFGAANLNFKGTPIM